MTSVWAMSQEVDVGHAKEKKEENKRKSSLTEKQDKQNYSKTTDCDFLSTLPKEP